MLDQRKFSSQYGTVNKTSNFGHGNLWWIQIHRRPVIREINSAFTKNHLQTWIGEVGAAILSRAWLRIPKTQFQALSKHWGILHAYVPYGDPIRVHVPTGNVPFVKKTRIAGGNNNVNAKGSDDQDEGRNREDMKTMVAGALRRTMRGEKDHRHPLHRTSSISTIYLLVCLMMQPDNRKSRVRINITSQYLHMSWTIQSTAHSLDKSSSKWG